jgi:hypothetical protein
MFEGVFIVVMGTTHILRRLASDQWDLLLAGMYIGTALIFTVTSFVANGVLGMTLVAILKDRADKNDFRYFEALTR